MTTLGELHQSRRFAGALGSGANEVSISFLANLNERGDLVLKLQDIQLNDSTKFIMTEWDKDSPTYFRLTGVSEDGASFATSDLYFNSIGPHISNERGSYFVFKPQCTVATLRCTSAQAAERPVLLSWLKGFQCLHELTTSCRTGKVVMWGDARTDDAERLSGLLSIEAPEVPEDIVAWRLEAEKLLEHVRAIMSFAAGTRVSVPVEQFRNGLDIEVKVTSLPEQRRADIQTFHLLDRQRIFETAVRSFHSPHMAIANLWMALEWFSMPATHNEVLLVNAMTALENLLNSNVADMAFVLEDDTFESLTKAMRRTIEQFIKDEQLDAQHPKLLQELAGSIRGLQRRSLKGKLAILLEKWDVPMNGLDSKMISAAVEARDRVVHRGRYYEEGEQTDLWVHVTVVRELIARIIFSALAFQGRYVSHMGGYHEAMFPPVAT